MSELEVITGCMFSGKTEEMLRRLRRAHITGQEVEVVKPEIDDRYGQYTVKSHNGDEWDAKVLSINSSGLNRLESLEADVVAIDEFNFFDDDFLEVVEKLVDGGTRVIIAGLDQDYRGDPFHPVDKAMAVADRVEKLSAICENCGDKATKTQRFVDGVPARKELNTIKVAGDENYEARCRKCHEVR